MRQCVGVLACLWAMAMAAPAAEDPAVAEIVTAIDALAGSLDAADRAQLFLPFNDEARLDWSYFPGKRAGLLRARLDEGQREQLSAVLQLCLSASGYAKAEAIRLLEGVLAEMEDNPERDPGRYYLAVYGEPGADSTWGLRWEGHHLSLNWTFAHGAVVSSTPQFLGSNPAVAPSGAQVQEAEETLARALVNALDGEARAQAAPGHAAPPDILTRMAPAVAPLAQEGIRFADLNPEQQGMLIGLIELYASVQPRAIAEERLRKIRTHGLDDVRFLWLGGMAPGEGHYYRIQGASFLIEFDNTQDNANHIHTVWRDFDGDFGRDVLREHYRGHASHHAGHVE